ncbi:alpha/beta hydrolase [Paractinoplanes deccanensis]|uniref:Alpha/beta hydrolase n=1 Tax=Paractinoplanes deccanensis TaxID=113561 RepID=A0ABQ3YAI1_9ACTN|nr:alpha/beta hydrolase [Actinoplanes deccanensis]GID77018.1 alpha/beta hydrolase [Actinoplanes deccanensis]
MAIHTVDVNGVEQRYHLYGQGDAVVVAMPGGPGVFWDYLRMPGVEQHARVAYVEALGTGESGRLPTHPDGYTRELYARALDRVIDDLGVARVFLLGHSYGGFVAQYYAATRPARLAGVILYDSAPVTGAEQGAEAGRQVELFVKRNEGNPEVPAVLEALQSVGSITDDDKLTAALRGLLPSYLADYWGREAEFAPLRERLRVAYISGRDADGNPEIIDDRELLPRITVPALVIAGRYDIICGERWAREIHELIPGSRLVILEHSGHLGNVEEPERFGDAVLRFIAANPK